MEIGNGIARVVLGLIAATASAAPTDRIEVANARELRESLLSGHRASIIERVVVERGCDTSGCRVSLPGVVIDRDRGIVLDSTGKAELPLIQENAATLPDIDWDPNGGYAVYVAGKRWGACLEFSHAGLGKSGSFQRWASVILVPEAGPQRSPAAYRFVGYWAACDFLADGEHAGEINLPIVEPSPTHARGGLRIVWHSCTSAGCKTSFDPRSVTLISP